MKTTMVFALAASLLLSVAAVAREDDSLARSGIKGGLTVASFTDKFDVDRVLDGNYKERLGFAAGFWINLGPAVGFSLQPEVLYVQKGAKLENVQLANSLVGDREYQFDYLEIPVLLRLSIPVAERSSFFLLGGPSFGYNVRADRVLHYENGSGAQVERQDIGDMIRDSESSWVAGAGIQAGILTIEGRYQLSMDTILEENSQLTPAATSDQPAPAPKLKNEVVSVLIGFAF